jgi:hypothetical protein
MTSDAVALDRASLFGDETIATPFGVVQLEYSFPADEPSVLLFDLDAQRAAQAYFWPLPLVGFAVFRDEQARVTRPPGSGTSSCSTRCGRSAGS